MDLFETTGTFWIAPGGDKEHPESWGDVIEWGALNIGDEAASDPNWVRQRKLMAGAGVASFPWLHVRRMGDLDRLLDTADRWGTRYAGVNIEDVLGDNISVPAVAARLQQWGGKALIIVLPWVPNGQGWASLRMYPFALEYFPFDPTWNPIFDDQNVLVEHACDEIGDDALLTFAYGTYPDETANPARYNLMLPHSLYPGDSIGPTPAQWNRWQYDGATSFITCGGTPMPVIGYNDGIAASVNRLRDMDPSGTKLVKGADGKWPPLTSLPPDLSTWKAYDKLQRTLQILKDDHDAGQT